jgi:hypothetical protein
MEVVEYMSILAMAYICLDLQLVMEIVEYMFVLTMAFFDAILHSPSISKHFS